MNKESLKKAREVILKIKELDINEIDKLELVKNLCILLDEKNYDDHIEILRNNTKSKKMIENDRKFMR